jgi:hypothetical protein
MPLKPRATEPEGVRAPKLDEADVEGHAIRTRAVEPDGVRAPKIDDDDDVEGHYGQIKSPSSRGE